MLQVTVLSRKEVMYEGFAGSVFLPGEYGEFEVLPFHSPIISVLEKGKLRIDDLFFEIRGGFAKMDDNNKLLIMLE